MKRKVRFLYNGALLTAVGLAIRGTQLLFGAYVARVLGADGVGVNTLVMMIYAFALTFATSGITLTVTRLFASAIGEGRSDKCGGIIRGAFLYAMIFGSLANLLLLLLGGVLGRSVIGEEISVTALRILSFSLIPSAFSAVISGYFVAERRVTVNAISQVAGQIFRIAVTAILLTLGKNPIVMLSLGVTLSEVFTLAIVLVTFLFDIRKKGQGSGISLSSVAGMALPLGVSAYLRSALITLEHNLIPKCLIRHGDTREGAFASYGYLHGMALPFILYPMTPLTSFSGLLVPEFAEEKGRENRAKMSNIATRAINTTLSYAISVSVLMLLFSAEFGYVLYGSAEAGRFIAILAPVVPIMYLDHVADSILKGIGEHIYSMWVNILDAIISVALVLILIPRIGIAGYAIVIIGMEAFNFTLSVVRLRRRVLFRLDFLRAVLIPLACAILSALLSNRLIPMAATNTTPLWLILRVIFALCVYVATRVAFSLLLAAFDKGENVNKALQKSANT